MLLNNETKPNQINETTEWELHKDPAYRSEQILEAAPYKTTAIQPLASHLPNLVRRASQAEKC